MRSLTLSRARELRRAQTPAERHLWRHLRKTRYHFRRQSPVLCFIVDFAHRKTRVAIELDGSVHESWPRSDYDYLRQRRLEKAGWLVLRFPNDLVFDEIEAVIEVIAGAVELRME